MDQMIPRRLPRYRGKPGHSRPTDARKIINDCSLNLKVACGVTKFNRYGAPPLILKLTKQVIVKPHDQYMTDQNRGVKITLKEENANKIKKLNGK